MDSSSVASHVVGMVKGVTTSFVIDMGIVLQVNSLPHFGLQLPTTCVQRLAAGRSAVIWPPAAYCCVCSSSSNICMRTPLAITP